MFGWFKKKEENPYIENVRQLKVYLKHLKIHLEEKKIPLDLLEEAQTQVNECITLVDEKNKEIALFYEENEKKVKQIITNSKNILNQKLKVITTNLDKLSKMANN